MNDNGQINNPPSGSFLETLAKAGLAGKDDILQTSLEDLSEANRQEATSNDFSPRSNGVKKTIKPAPAKPASTAQRNVADSSFKGVRPRVAKIKVVGVGGAGCNAIERMLDDASGDIEFIAVNTDAQALAQSHAPIKILLGEKVTKRRGAGSNPEVARKAAEQNLDELKKRIVGADLVFIAAGLGRGTGTGAAPIIADIAKKSGALTIAIVTKPFAFEGKTRMNTAKEGIFELSSKVDTLITIPNDRLLSLSKELTLTDAFKKVDDILKCGVKGISEILNGTGIINVDFADVQSILLDGGASQIGTGIGKGADRAVLAAQNAIFSPLLETSIDGSKAILFNITGDSKLSLLEVKTAADIIVNAADPSAKIVFGAVIDDTIQDDSMSITVLATGLTSEADISEENPDDQIFSTPVQASPVYSAYTEQDDIPAIIRRKTTVSASPSYDNNSDSAFELPPFLKRRAK